jgi:7-carboxy-7-deazaguanine synthase
MTLSVSEKFFTIAGEAPITGEPVYLIRFSGCNLSCAYCDTKYAHEAREEISTAELHETIVAAAERYRGVKFLLTGGEPLLGERQGLLSGIIRSLPGYMFYVETNGSIEIEDLSLSNCSYVVDMKTPSSGHEHSFATNNFHRLRPEIDCIKIVLNENDLGWVRVKLASISEENPDLPVYLSPQWNGISLEKLADFVLSNKLQSRISIQLHKMIWGADAKGV